MIYKVTIGTGSIFHKHKIERPNQKRKVFYTPVTINPKDLHRLTLRQQEMVKTGALFPLKRSDFKEILNRLNTTIKYKTRIQ